jgi:hypothetical protein
MVTLYGRPLIFTVFLLSIICFAHTLPLINAAAQVEIVSHSSYISTWGYYTIVGEIQNVGDQTVIDVEISPTYYNAEDAVIGNANISGLGVSLNVLHPGRKSPFSYTLLDNASQLELASHSLAIVDFTPYEFSTDRQKLNITSHSSSIVEGDVVISGEVELIGGSSTSLVKVLATCYDENGTVVNMGGHSAIHIEAGQPAAFEINIDENVPLITSYELTTGSPFYEMIPEFNSLLLTLLVVSLISIAFFLSKRKIIQNQTSLTK